MNDICEKCIVIHEQERDNINYPIYFWKNAGINIVGCDEHIKEVINILDTAQEILKKVGEVDNDISKMMAIMDMFKKYKFFIGGKI